MGRVATDPRGVADSCSRIDNSKGDKRAGDADACCCISKSWLCADRRDNELRLQETVTEENEEKQVEDLSK